MRESWEIKRIGDVCEVLDSKRKPITKNNRQSGSIPYYGATGIQDYVKDYIFDGRYLLIGEDGAKWGKDDNTAFIIEGKSWVNNHAHILQLHSNVIDSFVRYYLNGKDLNSFITGAVVPKLTQAALVSIPIPVPPLQEQEQIVAELDLLTGIIDKQKQQLQELDTLAQSIFYDMFGNPMENDKGWEKKQIGKICASKKQIQRASKRFKDSDIIRYIDISSIDNINNVMTSTTSYGFGDAPSRAQQVVEIGDVLISLVRPNLNNVAMVSEDGTDLVASSGFCVLRANCEIVKEFLFYSVKMKCFTDYLMQRVSGANYPAVREDDITGYNIILPPLELQASFAKKIQSIESQKESINRSIAESQKLFDYTMDKYFG